MSTFNVINADCRDALRNMADNTIDAVVTDPPYELGFMGKSWDASGIAYDINLWSEVLRVLKPGGHLLAFGGSRTYHRLASAIEDAGFEIRDQIMWVYGSGFPKSLDVSKAIDKAAGVEREVIGARVSGGMGSGRTSSHLPPSGIVGGANNQFKSGQALVNVTAPATDEAQRWSGWGTALKPAHEPIVVARKPLVGTVAGNVLGWGVGAINIDGCRVGHDIINTQHTKRPAGDSVVGRGAAATGEVSTHFGRWPANLIHDGSDEVLELFPSEKAGSAARFFYCAKAGKKERNAGLEHLPDRLGGCLEGNADHQNSRKIGERPDVPVAPTKNHHPTVKPVTLMRYLCRLVTPPGGTVLDPFTGSGTTGIAATLEGFDFVGIEQDPEYTQIALTRIQHHKDNR